MKNEQPDGRSAIDLLKNDHRTVEGLFAEFEEADDETTKVELARRICTELTIHAEIEERVFYPAARDAMDDDGEDLVREALVEHRSLKSLIAEIDGSSAKADLFEANVKVLKEYVSHHVKEEENELFPKVEQAGLDLEELGGKLTAAKERLQERAESEPPRGRGTVVHLPSLSAKSSATRKKRAAKKSSSHGRAAASR